MKLRGLIALAFALACTSALAQTNPGTSPLSIAKGGTAASTASGARTNLGLAIGSNVQAYDAELAAVAGLTSAADKLPYFTGSGTAAVADFTALARTLLANSANSGMRSTLGVVIGTDVQAYDAELAALAGLTSAANKCFYFSGSAAASTFDCSSFGRGLINSASAATARSSSQLNVDAFTRHGDSDYAIAATDRTIGTNATLTASRTWTLPAANSVNAGHEVVVADFQGTATGSNTIVIARTGGDTINGGASVSITTANGAYLLRSDGSSKWTAQALGAAAVTGVSSVGGVSGSIGLTSTDLAMSGANIELSAGRRTLPTTRVFTSGSGTYTTPSNVLWIEIEMCGGGAGGAGSGSTGATFGSSGGNSTFSTLTASGGSVPAAQTTQGAGGTASGGYLNQIGGSGGAGSGLTSPNPGGSGGASPFGGQGTSGASGGGAGGAAATNSCSGGGGGGVNTTANGGAGGGAGGYLKAIISSPAASYSYAVGAAGSGGSAGTGGAAGGAGGAGRIMVIEHYGS